MSYNNENNTFESKLVIYEENKSHLFNMQCATWIGKIPSSVVTNTGEENDGEKGSS